MKQLTVLSYGAGQDSTALLYKSQFDLAFRARFIVGDLIVVMANTGNEHAYTYQQVQTAQQFCKEHAIPFYFITSRMGYHPETWPTLQYQYGCNTSVGSKAFFKSCSDNLKIKPIYNFLADFLEDRYPDEILKRGRKVEYKQYFESYGKLRVLIGIAAGEESRTAKADKRPLWMQRYVDIQYPLIPLGMDRAACQAEIRKYEMPVPMPSNCKMCPYMDELELLWLFRTDPGAFHEWQRFEDAKLAKYHEREGKNVGVWGKLKPDGTPLRLTDVLNKARIKYADWTTEQLTEHKMSHGHCVKTSY